MLVAVAVPVPFLPLLTYRVPDGFEPPARGARVLVPVGPRQLTGCVVGPAGEASPADPAAIKPLTDVLDDEALLPEAVLDLALWVAEYYMAGPGEALAAAMPPLSTVASERRVAITAAGREALHAGAGDRSARGRVLEALAEGRPLTVAALAARAPGIEVHSAVRTLARDGLLDVQSRLTGKAAAFRTVPVASITVHGLAALAPDAGVLRGTRQREALEALAGAPAGIPLAELRDRGLAGDIVRRLASRGLATIRQEPRERDPFASGAAAFAGVAIDEGLAPTDEQRVALARLTAMADAGRYQAALLHA